MDEDEKSSQKSNSTTEEVATKSTKSGGDTGRRLHTSKMRYLCLIKSSSEAI